MPGHSGHIYREPQTVDIRATDSWQVYREDDVLMTGAQFLAMRRRLTDAEYERTRCVEALQRILDHGQTHDEPCHAIHNGDCADVFQEIARATLAKTTAPSRNEAP